MANISAVHKERFFEDGVVLLQKLLDDTDLNELDNAISENLQNPSPFGVELQKDTSAGRFFTDFNNWGRLPSIRAFCEKSIIRDAIKDLTGSKTGRLFHDHVLVKEGSSIATPWHQDRPYYIFKGDLNLSIWMPVGGVKRENSLVFWKGSHKSKTVYMPKGFSDGRELGDNEAFQTLDPAMIPSEDILDFEMAPGDALVFFNNTVHGSKPHDGSEARRALSIRLLLDGASMTKMYVNATPPFDRMGVKIVEDGDIPDRFLSLW